MTSEPVFDYAPLLEPVSEEFPCGESDTVADSLEAQIGTKYEQMLEEYRDGLSADSTKALSEFLRSIEKCFREECKSITLAFKLPGLLAMEFGLNGFRDGLRCIHELFAKYSEDVFPKDREKLKNVIRHGVFSGGDDDVTNQYRLFLLTPVTSSGEPLPYFKLRNAKFLKPDPDVIAEYSSNAASTSAEFYDDLVSSLDEILELSKASNELFGKHLEDTSVSLANFRFLESLEKMRNAVFSLADQNCPGYPITPVEETTDEEAEEASPAGQAAAAVQPISGEITTRQQAIEVLQKAAEYFAKSEPHSPVSYSLQETISWTKMRLPDLWKKLLDGDETQLQQLSKRIGINFSSDETAEPVE